MEEVWSDCQSMRETCQQSQQEAEQCACGVDYLICDHKEGTYVCTACGQVRRGQIIDGSGYVESQQRGFGSSQILTKTTTSISGNPMHGPLRTHRWMQYSYDEKQLFGIFEMIDNFCRLMTISSDRVTRCAKNFYKDTVSLVSKRGQRKVGVVCACIMYSCEKHGVPVSGRSLALCVGISNRIVTRGRREFSEIMRKLGKSDEIQASPTTASSIASATSGLNFVEEKQVQLAIERIVGLCVLNNALDETIASIAIYIATGDMDYATGVYGIAANTVLINLKKLKPYMCMIVQSDVVSRLPK